MNHIAVADGWALRRSESRGPLFPSILLVDENGNVREIGTISDPWLYKFLDALLKEHEE